MCVWVCLGALVVATLPNAVFKNVLTIRAIASIENWGGGYTSECQRCESSRESRAYIPGKSWKLVCLKIYFLGFKRHL